MQQIRAWKRRTLARFTGVPYDEAKERVDRERAQSESELRRIEHERRAAAARKQRLEYEDAMNKERHDRYEEAFGDKQRALREKGRNRFDD